MKRRITDVLIVLVILVGLGFLLYPAFSDQWNKFQQSRQINEYDLVVREMETEDFSEEWEKARAFNESLVENDIFRDVFGTGTAELEDTEYWDVLNLNGDGIMGYIEIPKIHEKLSIYHGTGDDVLQTGVGHVNGSKLPIGGDGNHTVLAAHRGLPSAKLFTDIDQLVPGDKFYIVVLDEVLAYEVDLVHDMVDKNDIETLSDIMAIVEGEDLVTLFTCTPYGINSHRLLVRGRRVEYNGELEVEVPVTEAMVESIQNYYVFYSILGVAIAGLILVVVKVVAKKKKQKN